MLKKNKIILKNILKNCLTLLILVYSGQIDAARRSRAFKSSKNSTKKTYSQKSAYSGFGKKSTVNGKIKTKSVSGHFKPSNGYKFINPYSRSR